MAKRTVGLGEFRRRAAGFIRQVEMTRQPLTLMRRGVPVAELHAVAVHGRSLLGSVRYRDPAITKPVIGSGRWGATA